MSYNSFIYLFGFLVAAWLLWAFAPQKWRPGVLLGASLVFYFASTKRYIVYILLAAAIAWGVGLLLGRLEDVYKSQAPGTPGGRTPYGFVLAQRKECKGGEVRWQTANTFCRSSI